MLRVTTDDEAKRGEKSTGFYPTDLLTAVFGAALRKASRRNVYKYLDS